MSSTSAPVLVDLSNYVPNLQREVMDPSIAATSQFTTLQETDWLGHLADAFWEARLDGVLQGYYCDENGLITGVSTTNYPANPSQPYANNQNMNWSADGQVREMVQLVILYASFRLIRNTLRNLRTSFSTAAGPVRYEYQQAATVLTGIFQDIINRRNLILARLSDLGTTPVAVIDSIIARDESLRDQLTYWVSGGDLFPNVYGLYGYSG
jgi:hypothetical protein